MTADEVVKNKSLFPTNNFFGCKVYNMHLNRISLRIQFHMFEQ